MQFKNTAILLLLLLMQPVHTYGQSTDLTQEEKSRAVQYYIEAINDFQNEDFEQALDKLTAAHLKLSEHAGINYALADVYLATGDITNAAYYAQAATELEPRNKWYHLKLAEIYRRAGRSSATIQAYRNILDHHPDDIDVIYDLAAVYVDFGELEKANEMLDKILALRGSDFQIHLRKFQNYNALHKRDEALSELEKMRALNPGNLSTLHTISQYYLELGDEEAALETLLDARERNSRDPQTLIMLAEIFVQNEDWDELGKTFITMLKDPLIYPSQKMELVRFIYLQNQNRPGNPILQEQTEAALLTFSQNEPEYGPAQLIAAEYFLRNSDTENALAKLEQATDVMPEDADAWTQRIQILFSLERYDEVIALSEKANEYAPDNAYIQFFTGAAYMLTDVKGEAAAWLATAAQSPARRDFRSIIYGSLGDVKHDLDQWDEAVEAYEMALRLDRNNHNAMNNYAYFLSLRNERLDYARELSERAVSMEPENAAYLDTIGWIYYKQGNYQQAKEYIRKSIDTGDASAEVYEHLGEVYNALEDVENARYWWEKAIEKDPERDHLNNRLENLK